MAGRVKADCGANSIEHSYALKHLIPIGLRVIGYLIAIVDLQGARLNRTLPAGANGHRPAGATTQPRRRDHAARRRPLWLLPDGLLGTGL
jgi:hypothetical protein